MVMPVIILSLVGTKKVNLVHLFQSSASWIHVLESLKLTHFQWPSFKKKPHKCKVSRPGQVKAPSVSSVANLSWDLVTEVNEMAWLPSQPCSRSQSSWARAGSTSWGPRALEPFCMSAQEPGQGRHWGARAPSAPSPAPGMDKKQGHSSPLPSAALPSTQKHAAGVTASFLHRPTK